MKKRIAIISILVLLTAVVASVYLISRDKTDKGNILVKTAAGDTTVSFGNLPLSKASGTTTNKKGETKNIDTDGYSLTDIPGIANVGDYSEISVFSDDEYHAVLTRDELKDHNKAWIIKDDDGALRLIVFGDDDSKRSVKNVVRIEIN